MVRSSITTFLSLTIFSSIINCHQDVTSQSRQPLEKGSLKPRGKFDIWSASGPENTLGESDEEFNDRLWESFLKYSDTELGGAGTMYCGPKHGFKVCRGYHCCSVTGFCGPGPAYCDTAQPTYGWVDPGVYKASPPSTVKRENSGKRCGKDFENAVCDGSECCSETGFCGVGSGFCTAPGCQEEFGICDAETIPEGLDTSKDRHGPWGLKLSGKVIDRCTKPRTLALTYDDGPNKFSGRILDLLEENNATATFFVAGITNDKGEIDITPDWIRDVKRMVMKGHQVASHTWSHVRLDDETQQRRKEEMYKNERAIANIIGSYPTYMRAPYSECSTFKDTTCMADMTELGYHVVGWEFDTADTEADVTLESMKAKIDDVFSKKSADDNLLVIQHEHTRYSYEVTSYLLQKAAEMNWEVSTVGDCLEDHGAFWTRLPLKISLDDVSEGGCHFATKDFCGAIKPFTDVNSCFASASTLR